MRGNDDEKVKRLLPLLILALIIAGCIFAIRGTAAPAPQTEAAA